MLMTIELLHLRGLCGETGENEGREALKTHEYECSSSKMKSMEIKDLGSKKKI